VLSEILYWECVNRVCFLKSFAVVDLLASKYAAIESIFSDVGMLVGPSRLQLTVEEVGNAPPHCHPTR
jgi:hypothetical protein